MDKVDVIPETAAEALAIWDSGQPVFTVEMRGLGPGYEMAIQGLAFEMIRDYLADPIEWTEENWTAIKARMDETTRRVSKEPWGGFSGAQVGAAGSLVACFLKRGYRSALLDETIKDRLIQVSKRDLRTEERE